MLLTTKNINKTTNKEEIIRRKNIDLFSKLIFKLEIILKKMIQKVRISIKKEKKSKQTKEFFLKNLKLKLRKFILG